MKKILPVLAGIVVGVVAHHFFHSAHTSLPITGTQTTSSAPAASGQIIVTPPTVSNSAVPVVSVASSHPSSPATVTPPPDLAAQAGQVILDTNMDSDLTPENMEHNVRRAIRIYGEMFGGDPVGQNSEITAALAGQNPKHVNFIDASAGMKVNGNGELIDAWGTPYFFHQLSATDMEIHSAGPDRVMWTADDIVVK